tara:strand:- start:54 stop:542 length:489 start_codon:yes stop_codon:yes gene_type:complete
MAVFYNGYEIKNVTLKMLYEVFEEAFSLEPQLTTITFGDIFEVDLAKNSIYPIMHVSTDTASYDTGSLTYSFQVIVMDLVNKDENNEHDVLSDMLEVIGNIISHIRNSALVSEVDDFRNTIRLQDSISCEPFTERFDNEVTGWTANISIEVEFNASACAGQI